MNMQWDASKVWLHHSFISLNQKLDENLIIKKGNPVEILIELVNFHKIDNIYWNRCYELWQINRDKHIKKVFNVKRIKVKSYNASLLWYGNHGIF